MLSSAHGTLKKNLSKKCSLIFKLAMHLILYSKPGCHLCEGLLEKLQQIQNIPIEIEERDITTREDWFTTYQFEIPVLFQKLPSGEEKLIPRPSPRASLKQLEKILQQ